MDRRPATLPFWAERADPLHGLAVATAPHAVMVSPAFAIGRSLP